MPAQKLKSPIYAQNRCRLLAHCPFPTKRAQFWPEEPSTTHRKLKVISMTLQSLVFLGRWAPSAVLVVWGTHTCSHFASMTKTSQPPAEQKEHHLWNRKKYYFSKVCLWDTSLLTMISDSFKTTSWEIYRNSKILSSIFPHLLVKTGGRDGESATPRKQIWNYLFWLELCVLLADMERGKSKHYPYAGQNLLIILDCGFSISVSLYVMELHGKTI